MSGKHILIVEDEPDAQMVLEGIASHVSVEVTQAYNAEDALIFIANNEFDALIIDIGLPGMDGLELIQRIREQNTEIPCIAVTAFHTSAMRRDALQAGFTSYVPKPIDASSFTEELQRVIA